MNQTEKESSPVTGLKWPREFQEVKVPRFHGKVVSLTHRPPLPPGNPPGTHLVLISVRG